MSSSGSITTEVVVIGGGITATAIAYALAKRGVRALLLLERRATPAGATERLFGVVRTYHADRVMVKLAARSLLVYEHFADEVGDTAEFVRTGLLVLVPNGQQEALERQVSVANRLGSDVRLLTRSDEALDIEPRLRLEGVAASAYEADAGFGNPVRASAAFAQRARDRGAMVREGIQILRIDTMGKPGNRSITGILTDGGYIRTRCVVNAGGASTNALSGMVDVHLPVKPYRYVAATMRPPAIFGSKPLPIVLDLALGTAIRPHAGGHILMGPLAATAEEMLLAAGEVPKEVPGDQQEYLRLLRRRFPELGTAQVNGSRVAAHEVSPDWHPVIGPVAGLGGYFCAVGMGGHAFCLAPAVGELVARMITDARSDSAVGLALPLPPRAIPLDPRSHAHSFRPDRFPLTRPGFDPHVPDLVDD